MGRFGFKDGVFFNGSAALLAGAGGVRAVTATDQVGWGLGWAGVVLGLGLFVWGVTIDGDHWWQRLTSSPPSPNFDMTFNALVRRVAIESEWAARFTADTPSNQWQKTFWWKPLKKEVLRALAGGDLEARGVLHQRDREPDTGATAISTEFWRRADFHPEYMLSSPDITSAVNGDRGEIYDDIEVKGREVDVVWRARSSKAIKRKPSPFVAWHKDWWEQQEVERLNDQMEMRERAGSEDFEAPPAPPVVGPAKAEMLAQRIREHPDTAQFDYPTLKCILRAEIRHPKGQRSAIAGLPPHATEVTMLVSSIHKRPIPGCSVFLQSIAEAGGPAETVMLPFSWGTTTFNAQPQSPHSFYLLKRNLSDPINPDPFVIRVSDWTRPLRENAEYKLIFELRAPPYPFPTIVELVVRTGFGLDVECEIISQHLPEIADD